MPVEFSSIPFSDQQASGLADISGAPPLMGNSLVDIAGTRRARPGISAWSTFPTTIPNASPVVGMVALGNLLIYVTNDRKLWAVTLAGGILPLSTAAPSTRLAGSLRPALQAFRSEVVVTGGGPPQSTAGTAVSTRLGGSPPDSKAVTAIATRALLVPNNTSGTFRWSGLGDSNLDVWDALNFAEAEGKPDPVQTIISNTNELIVFGTQSIQAFSPDPVVGFSPGRTLNIGLLAPYSVIDVDDQFAFFDRERRFVITDGRSFSDEASVISKTIESVLRDLTTVTDCWGFRMRTGRWDACVWFFPTEGKGFIWNRRSQGWSEWRAWGSSGYTTPTITSAYHWPEQNVFLVGLETGQIAKLDANAFTDLGQPIKVELVSGFQDEGTYNKKRYISAKFKFARGQTAQSGTAPKVHIYRRENLGPWQQPTVRDLGVAGDYEPVVEIRPIGVARQLQWKLVYDAAAEFTFVGAMIEFERLEN